MSHHGSPSAAGPGESCIACGELTAVGSVHYSDRRTIQRADGTSMYLCALCDARARSAAKGTRITDHELRNLEANGSIAATTWVDRGAF